MSIFELAARHGEWLAARQSVAAANIANADTPAYRARAVGAFETTLQSLQIGLAATHRSHLTLPAAAVAPPGIDVARSRDASHSGNTVNIETELLTIGENGRMQALDTGITKTFHRMLLASLKG